MAAGVTVMVVAGLLLLSLSAVAAFTWTSDVTDSSHLGSCVGDDVTFPWSYVTESNENVIVKFWFRNETGSFASFFGHQFITSSDRVTYTSQAGITLHNVSIEDRDTYGVSVKLYGRREPMTQRISLTVAEPPSTVDDQIHIEKDAQYFTGNGNLHCQRMRLKCGHFLSRGSPPVSVVWTDPSGSTLHSSDFLNGSFLLDLDPHRVKEGNYTCSLQQTSEATQCLASDSPLLMTATFHLVTIETALAEQGADLRHLEQEAEMARQRLNAMAQRMTLAYDKHTNTSSAIGDRVLGLELAWQEQRNTTGVLEGKLSEQDTQVAWLKSQVSVQNTQLSSLHNTVSDQKTQLSSLQNTVSDQNTQLSSLQNTVSGQDTQLSSLQSTVSDLNTQLSSLQNTVSDQNTQLSALQNTVSDQNMRLSSLQNRVSDQNTQLSGLQNTVSDQNTQLSSLQNTVSDQNTTISSLQNTVLDLHDENTNLKTQISDLQNQVSDQNTEISSPRSTVSDQNTEISSLENQVKGLQGEQKEQDTKIMDLQNQVSEQNATIANLQATVSDLQTENLRQGTQISGLQNQVSEQRTQISGLQSQVSDQKTQMSGLQNQVSEQKTQISGLQSQVSDQKTQISSLQSQVSEQRTQIAGLQSQVDSAAGVFVLNVALNKPTRQSSQLHDHLGPNLAVDGNLDPNYHHKSCTHTLQETNPWWRVDLGKDYDVAAVVITNRGDCCGDRLNNFYVDVFSLDPADNPSVQGTTCTFYQGAMKGGATEVLRCQQVSRGRYVRIRKSTPLLTLCEVQIMASFSLAV